MNVRSLIVGSVMGIALTWAVRHRVDLIARTGLGLLFARWGSMFRTRGSTQETSVTTKSI